MRKLLAVVTASVLLMGSLTGCQSKTPEPKDIAGYDEGEQYLSIWVHSIEDAITSNDNTTMGQTLAVITMVTIPVIIIYSLFSKQIVEGVVSTGSKEG